MYFIQNRFRKNWFSHTESNEIEKMEVEFRKENLEREFIKRAPTALPIVSIYFGEGR